MLTPQDIGAYQGYTKSAGAEPTLYFARGRFTQQHEVATNVGWHPIHAAHHTRTNISPAAVQTIMDIPEGDDQENQFAQEVIQGQHTDDSAAGILCECSSDDNQHFSLHISRSRLMRPGDAGFDPAYNEAYATAAAQAGNLAPNEH